MRRIVIGDLHGHWRGLKRLLAKVNYHPESDTLIFVGDYIDHPPNRYLNARKALDGLLNLKEYNDNVYYIMGNHDFFMFDWITQDNKPAEIIWIEQGGRETLQSFGIQNPYCTFDQVQHKHKYISQRYIDFFYTLQPFYLDDDIIAVHGGFSNNIDMENVKNNNIKRKTLDNIMWDRSFYKTNIKTKINKYKETFGNRIFICGHTQIHGVVENTDHNMIRLLIDSNSKVGKSLNAAIIKDKKNYEIIGV